MAKRETAIMTFEKVNDKNAVYVEENRLEADASDLGLKPFDVPDLLTTDFGNGNHFYLIGVVEESGELIKLIYKQISGALRLTVWND
jgi:hypothetical protein